MEAKEIISFIMILALVGILGTVTLYVNQKVDDKTGLTGGVYASGTLNFTGNVSCNQFVNITNAAGTKVPFEFYIQDGGCAAGGAGNVNVTLGTDKNTSTDAATNLTTAINANASIANTMTASNAVANKTVLTYDTYGTTGNSVILAEGVTGTWSAATLTGGLATDTYYNASQNVSESVESGFDFTEIIIIAVAAALIITAIFSVIGGYIKL